MGDGWEGLGCLGLSQSQATVAGAAKAVEMRRKNVSRNGPSFLLLASMAAAGAVVGRG
jgi:hypothetical protein